MSKLTLRERVLLIVLAVMIVGVGWYMLFYTPMNERLAKYKTEQESISLDITVAGYRKNEITRMEKELAEIYAAADGKPRGLAAYDNAVNVISFLNSALCVTDDYTLTFAHVTYDASKPNVVRRDISMSFSCASAQIMADTLQVLHDSEYRCLIKDISVTSDAEGVRYSVNTTVTFYEYVN